MGGKKKQSEKLKSNQVPDTPDVSGDDQDPPVKSKGKRAVVVGSEISNSLNENTLIKLLKELKISIDSYSLGDTVDSSVAVSKNSDQNVMSQINLLKSNIETINDKVAPFLFPILSGSWHQRSSKIVSLVESFISELLVLRPGLAGGVMSSLISKLCPPVNSNSKTNTNPYEISKSEEKIFEICHRNLELLFTTFPMKKESGVSAFNHTFPYMKKSSHMHYCFVTNILRATSYLSEVKGQLLHIIINKLVRIDVNILKQDIEYMIDSLESKSTSIKTEDGGSEMFTIDLEEEGTLPVNPLIETVDLCLNIMFEYVDYFFRTSTDDESNTQTSESDTKQTEQSALFDSFLQIFQTEILPTFDIRNVQFIYFYLLSLHPTFLTQFLDFLWKNATNINTAPVIRIQTMAYLSGILARGKFVSIKTVKRWLTRMSEWANAYAVQRSKACHWSSVNIISHGPFYAICQAIFYIFAFRNKELITSRKSASYTRTLDLGRLVTSELNPLKACEEQIAIFFVNAAHQHQISYCGTVLERNQGATIPTIARDTISNLVSEEEIFQSNHLESFFPFDPILLPRCKKWIEGIYNIYEPYCEEVKVERRMKKEDTEDSIEMELGSYNGKSFPSSDFYCNGVIPFKFKSEVKSELEGFID